MAVYDHSSATSSGLQRRQSAPVFRNSLSSEEFNEQGQRETTPSGDHGDERVDKVYTVGCFDLFHRGHRKLLKSMKKLGKEVIIIYNAVSLTNARL